MLEFVIILKCKKVLLQQTDLISSTMIKQLGTLLRGVDADDIESIGSEVINNAIGDLDDLELNHVQKYLFASKVYI